MKKEIENLRNIQDPSEEKKNIYIYALWKKEEKMEQRAYVQNTG